mmetsp:Transcript_31177/g.92975  ORF Transcript_31177/g.92975 Transcript_31177/m.92975 type:complete len:88 (+) Transcript_31177:2008-2271(+)
MIQQGLSHALVSPDRHLVVDWLPGPPPAGVVTLHEMMQHAALAMTAEVAKSRACFRNGVVHVEGERRRALCQQSFHTYARFASHLQG